MSESTKLEELQRRKIELRNQLQSMDGKERALADSVKMLEEKVTIHELEEQVKAKRRAVEHLESKKTDLERRLKQPQKRPESSPMPQKPAPPQSQVAGKALEPRKEPVEVAVSAAPASNQQPKQSAAPAAPQQPKKPEEKKEEQEKKKRKWF